MDVCMVLTSTTGWLVTRWRYLSGYGGSRKYRASHPYGWKAIQNAKDRPMMIDALPHLLMYLGGISSPLYRADLNVISPEYNQKRPRILKGVTDYDKLRK